MIDHDPETNAYTIVLRGGNLSIQVIYPRPETVTEVDRLAEELAALGGVVDGRARRETVFTVPVSAGFPAIERVMERFMARNPDVEWYYGNVFDPRDGVTPLNWWEDDQARR